jgi:hypothetical protein
MRFLDRHRFRSLRRGTRQDRCGGTDLRGWGVGDRGALRRRTRAPLTRGRTRRSRVRDGRRSAQKRGRYGEADKRGRYGEADRLRSP